MKNVTQFLNSVVNFSHYRRKVFLDADHPISYIYICVCVYVCMYVCMYVWSITCFFVRIHTSEATRAVTKTNDKHVSIHSDKQ